MLGQGWASFEIGPKVERNSYGRSNGSTVVVQTLRTEVINTYALSGSHNDQDYLLRLF